MAEAPKQVGFDLVLIGSGSTDARTGVVPAMVAERLGVPQLTLAGKVDVDGSSVTIRRISTRQALDLVAAVRGDLKPSRMIVDRRYDGLGQVTAPGQSPESVLWRPRWLARRGANQVVASREGFVSPLR